MNCTPWTPAEKNGHGVGLAKLQRSSQDETCFEVPIPFDFSSCVMYLSRRERAILLSLTPCRKKWYQALFEFFGPKSHFFSRFFRLVVFWLAGYLVSYIGVKISPLFLNDKYHLNSYNEDYEHSSKRKNCRTND